MNEIPCVRLFHECFFTPDRLEGVQQNLLAQVRAAGLSEADVAWCVSQQGFQGRFICFICVASVIESLAMIVQKHLQTGEE